MTFWIDTSGNIWVGSESDIPDGSRPLTTEEAQTFGLIESLYTPDEEDSGTGEQS